MVKIRDIQSEDDIFQVVKRFYEKATKDPIIGFFFTQVSPIDLDPHVEKVTDFWAAMVLGKDIISRGKYTNNMLKAHMDVDDKARLQTGHFTRWLYLFHKSVDELFEGETADRMKSRSTKMATSMSDALRTKRGENRVGVETLTINKTSN